jgi:hemoglobin
MPIYDDIGGRGAVAETVEQFYERVLSDPELAPYFANTDMPKQKAHLRAFIAAALGGPDIYKGRDMSLAHAAVKVTHDAFDRVVGHLVETLHHLEVPMHHIEAIGARLTPLRAQISRG